MKDESTEEDQKQLEERAAERALVAQVRQGDLSAFDALMDRYQDRVMRVIFSILKDPMDREEVTQDVFLTLFEKIDAFRGEASLSTWIHRIAVNAALMHKRRHKTRLAVTLPLEEVLPDFDDRGHILDTVQDWSDKADDPALKAETQAVINTAVERLDDKYRTVFLLRDVQGFSSEETAQILAMGVPAIKSRLHRARLQRELAVYFEKTTV
jgi:RNA polymerase sigma-70 factor (ECF subfamily)